MLRANSSVIVEKSEEGKRGRDLKFTTSIEFYGIEFLLVASLALTTAGYEFG